MFKKLYKALEIRKILENKKLKSRERTIIKGAIHTISRQIVSFAESVGSGIRFEKLFNTRIGSRIGPRIEPPRDSSNYCEFSFDNDSFFHLQCQVERKARKAGIPVTCVNPEYTSKRCSRCGGFGRRYRKRFECPHCGFIAHADVNAAFNIAAASGRINVTGPDAEMEKNLIRLSKKNLRRLSTSDPVHARVAPDVFGPEGFSNLLYLLEYQDQQMQCTPS